jgi:hypothetical protein
MLASVMDVQALPWSADWYHAQAQAMFGSQLDDHYRLWYSDNADHDPLGPGAMTAPHAAAHIVSYLGEMQQALLDLDAWVADGVPPAASTTYSVDANDQVHVPGTAARHGVQPVATLTASGSSDGRVDVAAGQSVAFSLDAAAPAGTGKIVRVEWDFEGQGTYPVSAQFPVAREVHLGATHTFAHPGTYFAVARVTSQREGSRTTPFTLVQNLARIRVVVH